MLDEIEESDDQIYDLALLHKPLDAYGTVLIALVVKSVMSCHLNNMFTSITYLYIYIYLYPPRSIAANENETNL
jgi:hypothetical protein